MIAMKTPQKHTLILVYEVWCPIVPGNVGKILGEKWERTALFQTTPIRTGSSRSHFHHHSGKP